MALLAFLCALPSLAMGLQADDFALAVQVRERGHFAAYTFVPRDPSAAHTWVLAERSAGRAPWWVDEHPRGSFFRPLSSLSLWFDFEHRIPPWWMHLENCAIYALTVWMAVTLYVQLGISGASLGWAAVFLALDAPFATSVGWIASRNTLLATCFGFACILFHDNARRTGRPALLALASLCFGLSLLSAELGLCTLGYLAAHAATVDRAPPIRRALALSPYAALTCAYLTYYVTARYGIGTGGIYRDVLSSPGATLLASVESLPIWLATTATLPVATLHLLHPDLRIALVGGSLLVLALLMPLLWVRWSEQPGGGLFALGALLSLVPLVTALPQERLRFFLAFGVYGLLGPWVVRDFDAAEPIRRLLARFLWRVHGVWLPVLFVPYLFSVSFLGSAVKALNRALPRSASSVAIVINPPVWYVPGFQAAMRAYQHEPGPPVFSLYAGGQPVRVQRLDERRLELHVARSWFATPFERLRDVSRAPFHVGDQIMLAHLSVEVREVDAAGAPTRARFTFERSLEDPRLELWFWKGSELALWHPPPAGGSVWIPAAKPF